MTTSPISPDPLFCFTAFVLLLAVSLSAPIWNEVSFLDVNINDEVVRFGVFGFTGSQVQIGYPQGALNITNDVFESVTLHNLTYVLILHPIAAGLSLLAAISGVLGFTVHQSGSIVSATLSGIADPITLCVLVVDLILFSVARNELIEQGYTAKYGNALWLTVAAAASLLIGFFTSVCGVFERFQPAGRRSSIIAYQKA